MDKETADRLVSTISTEVSKVILNSNITSMEQLELYSKIKDIVYGEIV